MKIREIWKLLKNIFSKKEAIEVAHQALASLDAIVPMPTREDFREDKPKLDLIEEYKKEYLQSLKQHKTITSIDLIPEELHGFKNIYTDLLINMRFKNNSDISFENTNENNNPSYKYVDIMLTRIKLMIYCAEVNNLEIEARLRLVALNEILSEVINEKTFMITKRNNIINALLCEINNLHSALIIFLNQKIAMLKEANAYINEIGVLESKDIPSEAEQEKQILIRLSDLKEIMSILMPEYLQEIESLNLNSKLLIAKLEQKLEMFVYTNQFMLSELAQKVEDISIGIDEYLTESRTDEYLREINYLELLYKVFSKYGRNLVFKKDIERLYAVKFKLLTYDIYNQDNLDILNKAKGTELECYQNIVMEAIIKFVKGESTEVKNNTSIIPIVKEILKNGQRQYNANAILSGRQLLCFLLSLDKENGIHEFMHRFKVAKTDFPDLDYYERIFVWDDELPFDTIFRIMECNKNGHTIHIELRWPLYHLYKLIKPLETTNIYKLPEGIKKIYIPVVIFHKEDEEMLKTIQKKCLDRKIAFPNSLREMEDCIFQDISVNKIYLNEGLRIIGPRALLNPSYADLTIPASVEHISSDSYSTLHMITFTNYYSSNLLNNKEELANFLKGYFLKYSCFDDKDNCPSRPDAIKMLFSQIFGMCLYFNETNLTIELPTDWVLDFILKLGGYKLHREDIDEIIRRIYAAVDERVAESGQPRILRK